ncbi:YveK family protein [Paenibacillus sp. J2TS4]|uniref:YveK family protein n=1 Tax=Paenibacillus sp. J2TS4 TaxID=2807194 RepID=UPI001B1D11F7|nr:Wzz/FepE/Etk N-terminal domain-containing protein [Paenibacillus sp. J2TS4]GIP35032.1 capsular polysaccharide biosynthesis protein [Paenibacillus sp. J2TS4]
MELEIRDYIRVIAKRIWWVIGIVLLVTTVTGVVSYFFLKPVYQASTKLIVNKTDPSVSLGQLSLNEINFNIKIIDTYKEVIKSPYIMEMVAKEQESLGVTAGELINKVSVSSVNNTQVMTVSIVDRSHERAVQLANAISRVFEREIVNLMSVDNVSVLSEAKIQSHPAPIKPNIKMNIAISFIVSLMAALGLIFLLEYLDDRIRTEKDVNELLGLPVLSVITKIKQEDLSSNSSSIPKQAGESHVTLGQ